MQYNSLILFLLLINNILQSNSKRPHIEAPPIRANKISPEQSVITLTTRNFDSNIRDGNAWLVEFYAPWCGHCKTFAPTYQQVAYTLHKDHTNEDDGETGKSNRKIKVAKVNASSERALAFRFNVKGYPSFYLIEGWTVRKFDGTRTFESLVHFANETYLEVEPMPFLSSPFGPIGQTRGLLISGGSWILECHEALVEKGLSTITAAALLAMIGTFVALSFIICIGLITVNKMKTD